MKLNQDVITLLQNAAKINDNFVFEKDSLKISTISQAKNIIFEAYLEEAIPVPETCGVYSLSKLLDMLKMFQSPDIEFKEKFILISEGKSKVKYWLSPLNVLDCIFKSIKIPEATAKFTLANQQLMAIKKAAGTLGVDHLVLEAKESGTTKLTVCDHKNSTSDSFDLELTEGVDDVVNSKNLTTVLSISNMKLLPGDYYISAHVLGENVMFKFESVNGEHITYIGANS